MVCPIFWVADHLVVHSSEICRVEDDVFDCLNFSSDDGEV